MQLSPSAAQCICLAGPTACGKSAAALAIADAVAAIRPVEVVSVDSALVYRGMDIGTAKPTAADRAQVPHHLIDLIDPRESYSAARFVDDARRAIEDIRRRGGLPLLVGGTMLYFKALFDGIDPMPGADAALRAEIARDAARRGWPVLHAELARVDPQAAVRISPTDAQRVQRALEVHRSTGRPISAFHSIDRDAAVRQPPPMISLEPSDRGWLHRRIAERFHGMLDRGLVAEVERLRSRGDLSLTLPSMRCVGYRQTWEALDRGELAQLPERAIAATRQLAKRQLTWLRGMPLRRIVACDRPDAIAEVVSAARSLAV